MIWHLLERIRALFGGDESAEETSAAEPDGGASPALFKCPECETTYISKEMQSCPECGCAVDRRPSADELGMGPDEN